jgi:tRNA A37 threonylcarbamoyladenosine synthetase subunit TsaC/SUA5/YrdC
VAKKLWDAYGDRVIVVKGKTVSSSPSTIIDLDKNQIVREGVIPTSEIAKVYPLINQKKD